MSERVIYNYRKDGNQRPWNSGTPLILYKTWDCTCFYKHRLHVLFSLSLQICVFKMICEDGYHQYTNIYCFFFYLNVIGTYEESHV